MRLPLQSRQGRKTFLYVALIVVAIAGMVVAGKIYISKRSATSTNEAQVTANVIKAVGELYLLPAGETPTVAEIQDKNKLPKQDFFNNAQTGDYLLVYSKAKVALLYRESVKKLVNVGPINLPKLPGGQ